MRFFPEKRDRTNRKLIEEIILKKYNQYYRLAYSYVHNEADAGDIVQNAAYKAIKKLPALKIRGLMAMLPLSDDESALKALAARMRTLYDKLKAGDGNFEYLSMGMSGDWRLCVDAGSNMIRTGTNIFGKRNYN